MRMRIQGVFLAGMVIVLLLAAILLLLGFDRTGHKPSEPPALFSQGAVVIAPAMTVGKVLVVDGDAEVAGRVGGWLAVVNGSLKMRAGGVVSGPVLVLGGGVDDQLAGLDESPFQLVLPKGSPLIGMLVWCGAAAVVAAMLAAAFAVWLGAGLLRKKGVTVRIGALLRGYSQRWPGLYALAGLLASGVFLAAFVEVAAETVYQKETELVDRAVIWLVRYFASPALDKLMICITSLGAGYAYLLLSPPLAAGLWLLRRRREAISLTVCLSGAVLLNYLLKHLFERARPDLFKVVSAAGYSFPSGHAMVSLCFYGVIAYILCRNIGRVRLQMLVYGLAAIVITMIGISRIYLGVHYPSDVLAGYLAGGMWLAFCVSLLWWREVLEKRNGLSGE